MEPPMYVDTCMRARRDVSSQSLRHVSVSGGVARAVVEGGQEQIDEPQPPLVCHDIVSQVDHRVCPMPFYVLLFAFGWRHLAVAVFDPLPQFLTIFPPFKRELNAPQPALVETIIDLAERHAVQREHFAWIFIHVHIRQGVGDGWIHRQLQGGVFGAAGSPSVPVEAGGLAGEVRRLRRRHRRQEQTAPYHTNQVEGHGVTCPLLSLLAATARIGSGICFKGRVLRLAVSLAQKEIPYIASPFRKGGVIPQRSKGEPPPPPPQPCSPGAAAPPAQVHKPPEIRTADTAAGRPAHRSALPCESCR